MAILQFNNQINVSVQPGDIIYFSNTNHNQGGRNHPYQAGNPNSGAQKYGVVTAVNHNTNTINVNPYGGGPSIAADDFIFFSKDRRVNLSGMIGYFAETEYRNYSKLPAEMFATAANYIESSK